MKKALYLLAALTLALPAVGASAADHGHGATGGMDHGSMSKGKSDQKSMPRRGKKIREAKVDGYKLEYYFMDMKEMMEGMKDMGMSMKDMDMSKMKTHHVMVFITRPDGKLVADAKVGYKIDGPRGEEKTMAGAMMGGHGADADFKIKGSYKLTMKAVVEEKALLDEFSYDFK